MSGNLEEKLSSSPVGGDAKARCRLEQLMSRVPRRLRVGGASLRVGEVLAVATVMGERERWKCVGTGANPEMERES